MARDLAARTQAAVSRRNDEPKSVETLLKQMKGEIARALPTHMSPDRIARLALTVFKQTPKLQECDPMTFIGALMTASQLGLEPGPLGEAYLVPYGRKVQFIPGYRGLAKLAWQSGMFKSIYAAVVYEGDHHFEYELGLNRRLEHRPALTGRGEVIAVYSVAHMLNGGVEFDVMSREDVEKVRARSKSATSGPWVTDWDEMAKKTVFKRMSKWIPLSTEMQTAIAFDGTTRTDVTAALEEVEPTFIEGEVVEEPVVEVPETNTPPEEPQPAPAKASTWSSSRKAPEPTEANPVIELVTDDMLTAIHEAFQADRMDKPTAEAWMENLLGRPVATGDMRNLTRDEGIRILTEMGAV